MFVHDDKGVLCAVLVRSHFSTKLGRSCFSASQDYQAKVPVIESVYMPTSKQGQQGLHPDLQLLESTSELKFKKTCNKITAFGSSLQYMVHYKATQEDMFAFGTKLVFFSTNSHGVMSQRCSQACLPKTI